MKPLLSGLSLGQLFIFGFEGKALPDAVKTWIRDYDLGGIIYFSRNIETPEQVKAISEEAQGSAKSQPLLISVDQEGGRVRRLRPPYFSDVPSAAVMGQLFKNNRQELAAIVDRMADEMIAVGINLDFAPVLDVASNPNNPIIGDRAFSNDPLEVSHMGQWVIERLHKKGIMACGKHFPGHGDTDVDSHLDLPILHHPIEVLREREWLPFQSAIAAGMQMIMTAHILFPELDPNFPATVSSKILRGRLRQYFGFDGLIITDDMGMKGIAKRYTLCDAAVLALQAGADMVLVCGQFDGQEALIHHIDQAVLNGILPRTQIEESLARIERIKSSFFG